MCTGNTIKTTVGDGSCNQTCDGENQVSNSGHTACGWFQMKHIYYENVWLLFCFIFGGISK